MSLSVLDYAKIKLLDGDFSMATAYYTRAIKEGVEPCVVNLRYLTKEYLVYPLEYENSVAYFDLLKKLQNIANVDNEYLNEYKIAVKSLVDIKRLFLRSLSLFYYSDILVSSPDSVVLHEITEIHRYIQENKNELINEDVYGLSQYFPQYDRKKFERDLDEIEAYCMNIVLSYTAVQHSVYQGKRYSAITVDYGYFYSTTVSERDSYYNYADVKPRLFLIGDKAYYYDYRQAYEEKLKKMGNFDSPKNLKKELTYYINHKDKKDNSAKDFIRYAKHFEKNDFSRQSWRGALMKIGKTLNPLLRVMSKLNPIESSLMANNVGSFELDTYFPQKKIWGVCSMLAAGKGWKVDDVRLTITVASCFVVGVFAYLGLAIAMKLGYYFGVNVEKP